MKSINRLFKLRGLLGVVLLLPFLSSAQTFLTSSYTNTYSAGLIDGSGTPIPTYVTNTDGATYTNVAPNYFTGTTGGWLWYSLPGENGSQGMTNDPSMDANGNPNSGSLLWVSAFFSTAGNQEAIGMDFAGGGASGAGSYNNSIRANLNLFTNYEFDIMVAQGTSPRTNSAGVALDFGTINYGWTGSGWDQNTIGTFTVPLAASNAWYHVVVPILKTSSQTSIATFSAAAGWFFNRQTYGTGGYPSFTMTNWIDNLAIITNGGPPPVILPPVITDLTVTPPGLYLFAGPAGSLNSRQDLETVAGTEYSWVGAPGPVSYSFTITNYPIATNDQFQTQIFLVPNADASTGVDYNDPNCIFLDMESTASHGTLMTFRYKTNNANANSMIYGTNIYGLGGGVAAIRSAQTVGTYTLTFNQNTNVTMSMPDGTTTNFFLQDDATMDTMSLFASGVRVYFGVQGNNTSGEGDHIVASQFQVTGLPSAFTDNFIADAGVLNTSIWGYRQSTTNAVQVISTNTQFLLEWSLPAIGFSLQSTPALTPPVNWTPASANPPFIMDGNEFQFVNVTDLQPGTNQFFSLIQHVFSQLQVLLPGETNAPGTATGKVGTPDTNNYVIAGNYFPVTVNAVDNKYNIVTGVTDTINLTTTDPNGHVPANAAMVNGTVQFQCFLNSTGSWTFTATDVTTPTITAGTSSQGIIP